MMDKIATINWLSIVTKAVALAKTVNAARQQQQLKGNVGRKI